MPKPRLPCRIEGRWCGGLGDGAYLAALDKGNGRINNNLIALFDSVVDLHLRAQISRHRHLADMYSTIFDHRYL
jgi:hypothetical protein